MRGSQNSGEMHLKSVKTDCIGSNVWLVKAGTWSSVQIATAMLNSTWLILPSKLKSASMMLCAHCDKSLSPITWPFTNPIPFCELRRNVWNKEDGEIKNSNLSRMRKDGIMIYILSSLHFHKQLSFRNDKEESFRSAKLNSGFYLNILPLWDVCACIPLAFWFHKKSTKVSLWSFEMYINREKCDNIPIKSNTKARVKIKNSKIIRSWPNSNKPLKA